MILELGIVRGARIAILEDNLDSFAGGFAVDDARTKCWNIGLAAWGSALSRGSAARKIRFEVPFGESNAGRYAFDAYANFRGV